jgi:aspartate-semialdehyde dehydrogenase
VELKKPASVAAVRQAIAKFPGARVVDEKAPFNGYTCPMPILADGCMEVLVGRIRQDPFNKKGFLLWAVGDNLWKGAAQNAIQIAECLVQK